MTRPITPIITRAMTPIMASIIIHILVAPFKETSYSVMNIMYVLSLVCRTSRRRASIKRTHLFATAHRARTVWKRSIK